MNPNEMTPEQLRLAIAEAKGATMRICQPDMQSCTRPAEVQSQEERIPSLYGDIFTRAKSGDDWYFYWPCIMGEQSELDDGEKYTNWEPCPDWPNSISAAWELVEEALKQGALCEIVNSVSSTGPAGTDEVFAYWTNYCATFRVFDDDEEITEYIAIAETAPLAICRAWLAWKAAQ